MQVTLFFRSGNVGAVVVGLTFTLLAMFILPGCAPTKDWKCYCKLRDTGAEYFHSYIFNEKASDAEAICAFECETIDEELFSRVEQIK